jgi:hypothetical protein
VTGRRVDFDAFRAEQKREPVILVIGGEEIELVSDLPAPLVLDAWAAGDDAEVSNDTILDLLNAAFGGRDRLDEIARKYTIGLGELATLAQMVIQAYAGGGQEAGNREARRRNRRATKGNGST